MNRGEKPGWPRFKGRHRRIRSVDIPTPNLKQVTRRQVLTLKGIGKCRFKGLIPEHVKQARVVITPRRIKVQLMVETTEPGSQDDRPVLGIDVGIKAQVSLSNGLQRPKRERDLSEVTRCQRRLSKSVKGSNNRRNTRVQLAKAWPRVQEREPGSLHELTADLVTHPSSRLVGESLRIKPMVKNHRLAKSIHDQPWGSFVS